MVINADLSIGYLRRRYDEAEAQARKTLEIDPRSFLAHYYLGYGAATKGTTQRGDPGISKSGRPKPRSLFHLHAPPRYARNGQTDEARKLLAQLNEMAKSAEVPEYALALAYTSLGDKERAIEALEHAFAGGNKSYLFLLPGRSAARRSSRRSAFRGLRAKDYAREIVKIDNGTGGSRETSTGGSGSRPGRSAVEERGRESINFFAELKRRNVYKVAVAYAVVAWLLVQVATQVFPFFEIPNWAVRLVVLLLILGFPVALTLSWIFEITPEGIKRESAVEPGKSIPAEPDEELPA